MKKLKKTISELLDIVANLKNLNAELDKKRKRALNDYLSASKLKSLSPAKILPKPVSEFCRYERSKASKLYGVFQ